MSQLDKRIGLLGAPVKLEPSNVDLFSRVSIALNSPLDVGEAVIGELLSQIPEFRLEFGTVDDWLPELHDSGIYAGSGPMGDPPYGWDVGVPFLGREGGAAVADVRSVIDRYPALRGFDIGVDPDGKVVRSQEKVHLLVPSMDDLEIKSGYFRPTSSSVYRRHDLILPSVGSSEKSLQPLMSWWLVLYALSMVARYSPSDWTAALSISSSPIASKIEHVLDAAVDAVPDLIAEALTGLNS
ncbi:YaaC family protein [Leifsonia kafniensis]|uniref:YaaC family protein n=1 Tax=Leifsonia kafniensis TaxID=475957 RepID=UPI0031E8EB5C